MSSKYDAVAGRALATIARKGADVTFPTTTGTPVYNPITDTWSGGTTTTVAGKAVQTANDLARVVALNLVNETTVTLLVAAKGLTVTPSAGEPFTWAGKTYVIRGDPGVTAPDGTPILYEIVGST